MNGKDQLEVLAVIPARGGSKGLPRKNLRCVGGQPLVARTIAAAQAAASVRRIVVSTDDAEIAAVARAAGADVVRRPAALSEDTSVSEDALLHALEELERSEAYRPDVLVFLQCTSPFTSAADIDGTVGDLLKQSADCALSVIESHPFLWSTNGRTWTAVNHDPSRRLPRQSLTPQYRETGAVYAMRVAGFKRARNRFFGRITAHVMPQVGALDIDDELDLRVADAIARSQEVT